jgi:mono/diheme cytochrome c family protein
LLFSLIAAGCSGLSGEPKVVTTLRPAATTAPVIDTSDPLALGAQIFVDRCISCHGPGGRGDGDLVRAGQIANVPDFTDPARRAGLTVEDYFEVITNGRIEKLMPPWKDALSEDERWAVAQYAFSLADDTQVALAETPSTDATTAPEAAATSDSTEAANETPNPHATLTAPPETTAQTLGIVEGTILNGTEGADAPDSVNVLLFVMNPAGDEVFTGIAEAAEGVYRFEDVPIEVNNAYFASAVYNDVTFVATLNLTADRVPSEPQLDLPVTVYEVTNDPSVIEIDLLLNQAATRSAGLLDNLLVTRFYNSSDRVYREAEALSDGRLGSVGVRLPAGASPVGLDTTRYFWDQSQMRVVDTLAVIPDTQHIVHVSYTVPLTDRITYEYTVDYPVTNQPEIMLRPGEFIVNSQQFQSQGVRQFTGGQFEDYLAQPLDTGETVKFELVRLQPTAETTAAPSNQSVLGVGLMIAGVVFLGGAGGLYLLQRRQGSSAESLIAQIAALDLQHQDGQMDEQAYQRLRDDLKRRLADALRRNPPAK